MKYKLDKLTDEDLISAIESLSNINEISRYDKVRVIEMLEKGESINYISRYINKELVKEFSKSEKKGN